MSNICKDLAAARNGNMEAVIIKNRLEKLFLDEREQEDRYGLHASAVIASDEEFCYRAQLLSLFYNSFVEDIRSRECNARKVVQAVQEGRN